MADYDWPADLVPQSMSFYLEPHTGRSESPFTRQMKTYELTAPRWRCRMTFLAGASNLQWGDQDFSRRGPRLDSLIARLRGGANRAGIYDFRRDTLQGDLAAGDLGNLAADAGATVITLTGGTEGDVMARDGDYLGGDGRAHLIDGDVIADADGQGKARFWPPLDSAIAADEAEFGTARSYFRLTDDGAGNNPTGAGTPTTYDLEFVEDRGLPDIAYPDMIPTAAAPAMARKVEMEIDGATEEVEIYRTRTSSLAGSGRVYFDEYVYRNPDGHAGISNGRLLWRHWTYAKGRYFKWYTGAESLDDCTTAEFALRFGLLSATYSSGGEGPDYAYDGYLHGRLIFVDGSIVVAGDATNYLTPGNWVVGQTLSGTSIAINFEFTAKLFDGTTTAATVEIGQLFDADGLREFGTITDDAGTSVGWNDSYTLMMPFSHEHVDWYKPEGEEAVSITGSGTQKGNWNSPMDSTTYQGYGNADPTIMVEGVLVYGQPVRRPDDSLPAWGLNTFRRAHIIDHPAPDFPKGYVFAASSAEAPEDREAWELTGVYEWQNRRRGRYRASGPI